MLGKQIENDENLKPLMVMIELKQPAKILKLTRLTSDPKNKSTTFQNWISPLKMNGGNKAWDDASEEEKALLEKHGLFLNYWNQSQVICLVGRLPIIRPGEVFKHFENYSYNKIIDKVSTYKDDDEVFKVLKHFEDIDKSV